MKKLKKWIDKILNLGKWMKIIIKNKKNKKIIKKINNKINFIIKM